MGQVQHVKDGLLPRFLVNINDLRAFDAGLAARVVRAPVETVVLFEAAVKEVRCSINSVFIGGL